MAMRLGARFAAGFFATGAAAALAAACIDFDGLDSAEPDSGAVLQPNDGASGFDGGSGCSAQVDTDPFNCGGCGHICPLRQNSIPACTGGACGLACNGNFGNCDKDDENGCETQLLTDPKNCGACARDCSGGACTAGMCQPITLATNQSSPQTLALDTSTVYWGALYSYTVDRIAKDGGTTTTIASNEVYPAGIALDATHLYWTDRGYGSADGLVRRAALTGGAPQSVVAGLSSRPTAVAVVGTDLFYVTLGGGAATDGTVVRVPATNVPEAGAGVAVATKQNNPTFVVSDATSIYWTNYGTTVAADAGAQNGSVMRCAAPACTGGAQAIAAAQNHPRGIAVDTDYVYWTNYGSGQNDGAVMKAPKASSVATDAGAVDGGGATVMASGLLYPDAVAVDDKHVYFTTRSGLIQRVPLAGAGATTPETVVTVVQSYPIALAVDAQFLYFATASGPAGGSIQKVLK